MDQKTRVDIRTIQRDNFRKAIKLFMASKGYVNNEEVAKVFGFKKSWLDNLMVKRENIRIPTLPDLFAINQVQTQLKAKGQKAEYLNLWKIIFNQDQHPEINILKRSLKELQEKIRKLEIDNAELRGKIEVYKTIAGANISK